MASEGPQGEKFQLDFYFRDRSSADAFRDVVFALLEMGAEIGGKTGYVRAREVRCKKFAGTGGVPNLRRELTDEAALRSLLLDPDVSVRGVLLRGIFAPICGEVAAVDFNPISDEASHEDTHPVSIVGEGWVFSTPGYEGDAIKAGASCYQVFTGLCNALNPFYAAILNEESLPCVHDLHPERHNLVFCDFYLGGDVQIAGAVRKLFSDAYIEELGQGCYISTSGAFNPQNRRMDRQISLWKSSQSIAILLGKNTK